MKAERVITSSSEMTDNQRECYMLLVDLVHGEHHISGPVRTFGNGIKATLYGGISTFDSEGLTRLVVLAHDRCIRAEIVSSNPCRIGLELFKRKREGMRHERHPTMEDAIAMQRPKLGGAQNE